MAKEAKAKPISEKQLKIYIGTDAALQNGCGCKPLEYRPESGFYIGDHRVNNRRIIGICKDGFGSPATKYKTSFVRGGLIE